MNSDCLLAPPSAINRLRLEILSPLWTVNTDMRNGLMALAAASLRKLIFWRKLAKALSALLCCPEGAITPNRENLALFIVNGQ